MKSIFEKSLRKFSIVTPLVVSIFIFALIMGGTATYVWANTTSNWTQTISAGSLTIDIVDAAYASVSSPTIAMTAYPFSFSCQSATGTFGTATEQVYVSNPDAAGNGWTASIAGTAISNVWDSAGTDYDFNDPTSSGCTDGADAGDSVGGQMTVDPSVGSIAAGDCGSCDNSTGMSLGSSDAFEEGVTNSITLYSSDGTQDIGDWTLQGVSISNTVPAEQPAAVDYDINMIVSVLAS